MKFFILLALSLVGSQARNPILPVAKGQGEEQPEIPQKIEGGKAGGAEPEPSQFCFLRGDGYYEEEACASYYVSCSSGSYQRMDCPDGAVFFDEVSQQCLRREYVPSCGGQATTTLAPEPRPLEEVDFDCSDREDGWYVPEALLLNDYSGAKGPSAEPRPLCSDVYFSCSGGAARQHTCQSGTRYDLNTNQCLEPEWVEICGGVSTTTTEQTLTELITEALGVDCQEMEDGLYPEMSLGVQQMQGEKGAKGGQEYQEVCGNRFVQCSSGYAHVRTCVGEESVFDSVSGSCLERAFVEVCGGVSTTTAEPVPAEPIDFDCAGKIDGFYVPMVPSSPQQELKGGKTSEPGLIPACSQVYFSCVGEQAHAMMSCQEGFFYDTVSNKCLESEWVAACGGVSTTTTEATLVELVTEIHGVDCSEKGNGIYPEIRLVGQQTQEVGKGGAKGGALVEMEVCSRNFVICSGGYAHAQLCPEESRFDSVSGSCQPEAFNELCGGVATTTPEPKQAEPLDFDCEGLEDGFYVPMTTSPAEPQQLQKGPANPSPVELCSQLYYSCVAGEARALHSCVEGHFYDTLSGMCLESAFVPACGGVSTTTVAPEIAELITESNGVDCSVRDDGIYAERAGIEQQVQGKGAKGGLISVSEVCSPNFVICSGGYAFPDSCPAEFVYDPISESCQSAQYVELCGGVATTTAEPNQAEPINFDCAGKIDGYYVPMIPSSPQQELKGGKTSQGSLIPACSRVYYSCVGEQANAMMSCSEGHFYDVESNMCMESRWVPACGGEATTTVEPEIKELITQIHGVDCTLRVDGVYPELQSLTQQIAKGAKGGIDSNIVEVCSRNFVLCSGGYATAQLCPVDTRFDTVSMSCLPQQWVALCGGESTTTEEPLPFEPIDFDCSGRSNGYHVPYEFQQVQGEKGAGGSEVPACSKWYYNCQNEVPLQELACGEGLRYDVTSAMCLEPLYVAACGGVPTTTEAPDQQEKITETIDLGIVCSAQGIVPDAREGMECSRYFGSCPSGLGERATTMRCAAFTRFDPETSECRNAAYIRVCGGNPTTPTPTEPEPEPEEESQKVQVEQGSEKVQEEQASPEPQEQEQQ